MATLRYAKQALSGLEPYVPGEQPSRSPALVKLNTNENPYPPSPRVEQALREVTPADLIGYPDPLCTRLRATAADLLGVEQRRVFAGNGSDELLAMALRAFVDPGAIVAFPTPTYSLYETLAIMYGGRVSAHEAAIGSSKIDAVIGTPAALTLIATPNSPDGYRVTAEDVARLCEARQGHGVVVADEAYVDFCEGGCMALVDDHDNLLVTRTLSKSFSLAGLRVGIGVAGDGLIDALFTVKDSYNLGYLPQCLATAALSDPQHMRANARRIVQTREETETALHQRGWHVYPSSANFIFAEPPNGNAKAIYQALAQREIYVRYFSRPPLDKGLRISIGTDSQMEALLGALDVVSGEW